MRILFKFRDGRWMSEAYPATVISSVALNTLIIQAEKDTHRQLAAVQLD